MFERGKVVLVPFPFTDLSAQKIRPAVIVSNPTFFDQNVVLVFVTSNQTTKVTKVSVPIKSTTKGYLKTGLKKESVIRCDKIATLQKTLVLGEIGQLSPILMASVSRALKTALKL